MLYDERYFVYDADFGLAEKLIKDGVKVVHGVLNGWMPVLRELAFDGVKVFLSGNFPKGVLWMGLFAVGEPANADATISNDIEIAPDGAYVILPPYLNDLKTKLVDVVEFPDGSCYGKVVKDVIGDA